MLGRWGRRGCRLLLGRLRQRKRWPELDSCLSLLLFLLVLRFQFLQQFLLLFGCCLQRWRASPDGSPPPGASKTAAQRSTRQAPRRAADGTMCCGNDPGYQPLPLPLTRFSAQLEQLALGAAPPPAALQQQRGSAAALCIGCHNGRRLVRTIVQHGRQNIQIFIWMFCSSGNSSCRLRLRRRQLLVQKFIEQAAAQQRIEAAHAVQWVMARCCLSESVLRCLFAPRGH